MTVDSNQDGRPNYYPNSFMGPADSQKWKEAPTEPKILSRAPTPPPLPRPLQPPTLPSPPLEEDLLHPGVHIGQMIRRRGEKEEAAERRSDFFS